jgi:hypothetical protein
MDIKDMNKNFSVEALLDPRKVQQLKNQFDIDYLPMWHFLDNLERKTQGFRVGADGKEMGTGKIFEAIYEYAIISVSLDKADMQTRIDNLNEQNLKWYTKADQLEAENARLKLLLQEKQSSNEN